MNEDVYTVRPVGLVRSELKDRKLAPRQGREGAPDAWIELAPAFRDALEGLMAGGEVIALTWFHQAERSVLKVHPRSDPRQRLPGVFATRSPDRPNPIGLHKVIIHMIDGLRLHVGALEAIDGTPVVDIKPVLSETGDS